MPLANSNGPRWIRWQNATIDRRLRGVAPIRAFLARLFGRRPEPPRPAGSGPHAGDPYAAAREPSER